MELKRLPLKSPARASGFILVSLAALIPLFMTAFLVVAGAEFVMRKKLKAQALCVSRVVALQSDLGRELGALLKLNSAAKRLRLRRATAEARLVAAIATAHPAAIAAAKAERTAVVLQQVELAGRQTRHLLAAERARRLHHQILIRESAALGASRVESRANFPAALAVAPRPPASPSPDYVRLPDFSRRQEQGFTFKVELAPEFLGQKFPQTTRCAATLTAPQKKGENSWTADLTEASAPLKRL